MSGSYRIETPHVSPDWEEILFHLRYSRTGKGWSEPEDLGSPVNTTAFESCPSTAPFHREVAFSNIAGDCGLILFCI